MLHEQGWARFASKMLTIANIVALVLENLGRPKTVSLGESRGCSWRQSQILQIWFGNLFGDEAPRSGRRMGLARKTHGHA